MVLKCLMLLVLVAVDQGILLSRHWVPWKPGWLGPRDDLLCNSLCEEERDKDALEPNNTYDRCCTCRSLAVWEKDSLLVGLDLEYITAIGGSVAFLNENVLLNGSYKQIIHKNGVMTSLPINLCNISNLMAINFFHNMIRSLSGIECATSLDTVNLDSNRIEHVSNMSFMKLSLLRHLNLANNLITKLDSMTLFQPNLRLFRVDFSNNFLTDIDISNAVTAYRYCRIEYSNNKITKFTNTNGHALNLNVTYGPGFTSFENNKFETFPNFQQILHLDNLSQIGKLFACGFDFRGVPIVCDCNIETYLNLGHSGGLVDATWQPFYNVKCTKPDKYAGVPVVNVPLQDLVCSLGVEDNCPIECSCVDQPYYNTIEIECVDVQMTSLPVNLPTSYFSDKLSLNVSCNKIAEIPDDLSYLDRIEALDISDNNLKHISEKVANKLENASLLMLANNPSLKSLPQVFQYRNACSLGLGEQIVDCNCDSLWIERWIDAKGCQDEKEDAENMTDITTVSPSDNTSIDTSDRSAKTYTIAAATTDISKYDSYNTISAITAASADYDTSFKQNITSRNYSYGSKGIGHKGKDFYCNVPGKGVMQASDFRSDMLRCGLDLNTLLLTVTYALITTVALLVISASVVYIFRYEFLILYIRAGQRYNLSSVMNYDAFVSFDENNADLMKWMERILIPHLEHVGYKLFIHYLHMNYGGIRCDLTIEAMTKSRTMLLVMSESYLAPKDETPATENEWKYGWNNFKSSQKMPIIMINYDHITTDMVNDPRVKAYLRVGKVMDFTNCSRDILSKVELVLGKPLSAWKAASTNACDGASSPSNELPEIGDISAPTHYHPGALLRASDQVNIRTVYNYHPGEQFESISDDVDV